MKVKCRACRGKGVIEVTELAACRIALGLTQEAVASAIGMQRAAYAMVEGGRARLKIDRLVPLANILELSVEQLIPIVSQQPIRKATDPADV